MTADLFDLDLEERLIGAGLVSDAVLQEAMSIVRPSDFWKEDHAALFAVLTCQGNGNIKPDVLERIGNPVWRSKLMDRADLICTRETAGRIADLAWRRRWADGAAQLAKAAYNGHNAEDIARKLLDREERRRAPQGDWQWRTLEHAYQDRPPRFYLAGRLLSLPSLSTVYGPSGGLKTMLVQDLAICVAAGLPWLEPLPGEPGEGRACESLPVLWLDVDNGDDRTTRRFAALGRGHQAPAAAPLAYVSFPSPPFVASNPGSVQTVIEKANRHGAGLVVFDNLGTISGGADENSSQMVAVMAGLRSIAEKTGAAVLVVHHRNKATGQARAGDALRGHTSIEGALDLALQVERAEGEDVIALKSTKTRDAPVEPFAALWTYEPDGEGELVSGRFYGMGRPESASLTKQAQAELCIMAELQGSMGQSAIVNMVKEKAGVSRCTTLAALKSLTRQKKLYARAGGRGQPVIYERG